MMNNEPTATGVNERAN